MLFVMKVVNKGKRQSSISKKEADSHSEQKASEVREF
jgi:hypothetical protein